MPKRRGRKSAAQTPAPRSERIYGSKKNKPGSASSEKSASKIVLSQEITDALKKKADEYNEKHSNKVSLSDLKAVFRRGAGAYSKTHRPTITGGRPNSRNAWAYARVNKFLKKKAGQKVKAAYVQDDDLLKDGGRLEELLAPNGKPSNLTPEQYKLVRTPEFKAWFGDWEKDPENASKVVDENGEPLVVYHGTYIETPFYEFRKYSYWTDSYESAKSFPTLGYELNAEGQMYNSEAENIWKNFKSENVRVYSCFIKLKKPKIFNYEERFEFQDIEVEEGMPLPKILESLLEQGYDSMRMSGGDEEHFIVFEPNQIKLADGSNTTFDEGNPDIRYDNGGYILVRNDAYDTSMTKRRLPYLGVSAFSIKESDFDGLKQYAQREYEVAPESWTILKIEDFGNCTVSAMKMEETNDYVMQFSDQKPIQEQYEPEKHSLNFEDGSVDYEDAYEVMIQPVPKYFQGGMAAMLLKDTIDSADNINAMVVYSLENDINPKKLSEKEFNEKINPEGKYSDFEVRLAKRELNRYFADGGQTETMEITCQKCGWSWDSSETTPEEMMICHKCGHNNLLPVESEPSTSPYTDTIQMNGPAFLRALEFAREDAKTDMDLHKLTENAIRLSKSGLITMEQYEQMVPEVQMADEGAMVMEEPVEEKYISVEEYIQKEKDEAEAVECCEMSKLSKIMICQGKIDLAENKIKETESVSEQQAWSFIESIWRKCLNNISKNYKKGGETDCGCSKFDNGGLAYGNSHDNGGMPLVVKSTGQNIEIEGGEGVVNKRSMKIDKKVEFEGKKMTPCEVVSKINQMGGGVKFKCDDVKDIIAEDGNF